MRVDAGVVMWDFPRKKKKKKKKKNKKKKKGTK